MTEVLEGTELVVQESGIEVFEGEKLDLSASRYPSEIQLERDLIAEGLADEQELVMVGWYGMALIHYRRGRRFKDREESGEWVRKRGSGLVRRVAEGIGIYDSLLYSEIRAAETWKTEEEFRDMLDERVEKKVSIAWSKIGPEGRLPEKRDEIDRGCGRIEKLGRQTEKLGSIVGDLLKQAESEDQKSEVLGAAMQVRETIALSLKELEDMLGKVDEPEEKMEVVDPHFTNLALSAAEALQAYSYDADIDSAMERLQIALDYPGEQSSSILRFSKLARKMNIDIDELCNGLEKGGS